MLFQYIKFVVEACIHPTTKDRGLSPAIFVKVQFPILF